MEHNKIKELLQKAAGAAERQDFEDSIDLAEQALEMKPGDIHAMNIIGYAYWRQGDAAEAERYYRACLDIDDGNAYSHKGLGLCLVDQGKTDMGIGELKRAIDLRRNWAEPYHDLGVILSREKRYLESWHVLDVATKLDPAYKERLKELLAQLRERLGITE